MKQLPVLIRLLRDPAAAASLGLPQWELALRQALAANLSASLEHLLRRQGVLDDLPLGVQRQLRWAAVQAQRHRQAVAWEIRQIRQALDRPGVPLLLLKGAAYVAAELDAGQGRLFSDIDVLVERAVLAEAESALMLHGWTTAKLDPYDQRYYRVWMHEIPPMIHPQRGTAIDVHHAILPLSARVRPDPAALRAGARAVPGSAGVQVLGPLDMVLHSATHLFYDGEFDHGLRDLLDIHRLLGQFGADPEFWEALPARAHQLQLGRPLFYALRYARLILHTPVPDGTLAAVRRFAPNPLLLWLMDRLFERALMPPHPSCAGKASGAARFALYVRGNWLRMPPLLLARHLFHKASISSKN